MYRHWYFGDRESSRCQLCRHWCHRWLLWQHIVVSPIEGGTGILIQNDIIYTCQQKTDLEDQNQDVCWANIQMDNSVIHLGVYYGKQEQALIEDIRIHQTYSLANKNKITRRNNPNRRLQSKNRPSLGWKYTKSRNRKIMAEFIQNAVLIPVSINPQHELWSLLFKSNGIFFQTQKIWYLHFVYRFEKW